MKVDVTFTVKVNKAPEFSVWLVGNDETLGSWHPEFAILMDRQVDGHNWDVYSVTVKLNANTTYRYRFFTGRCKNRGGGSVPFTVDRWETNINPREVTTTETSLELPLTHFGKYDGFCNIGKGWLINQSEVLIRLHDNPIFMWKQRHREQTYSIKCVAMDYTIDQEPLINSHVEGKDDNDSREGPPPHSGAKVLVSNLSSKTSEPVTQEPCGTIYNKDDYMTFRTLAPCVQDVGFQLDFFVCNENITPKFVGCAHLLPVRSKESVVKRKQVIIGCNHKPIGEIMVEFLVVKPLEGMTFTMETSFQTHWKWRHSDKPLNVGHRGMGSSYKSFSTVKENTLRSLNEAARHGADFVEFDVLLSKDRVPLIFHDYTVCISYTKRENTTQLFEIPVKDLTMEQLHSVKLFHHSSGNDEEIELNSDVDQEDIDPFPTLERVLTTVDENTGFNMEIKFPLQDANGVWEMENYFDINDNLDRILSIVFAHAGSRKIIFSSFDPDTCILLQQKQNRYPVLFLTQGETLRYVPYKDCRASTFRLGIQFALTEHLLGMALHSEVLLLDLSVIDTIRKAGLVMFVWGDDNNDRDNLRFLRTQKVDGIIYDRIDHHHLDFELKETDVEAFRDVLPGGYTIPTPGGRGKETGVIAPGPAAVLQPSA